MSLFLLLDCGNTAIKCAVYCSQSKVLDVLQGDWQQLVEATLQGQVVERVLISSVRSAAENARINEYLSSIAEVPVFFAQTQADAYGVRVAYTDVSRLGVDRWLVMLASRVRAASENFVVVDMGTALTVDYVVGRAHQGGYIVPGVNMLLDALNQNTSNVQAKSNDAEHAGKGVHLWGRDTHQCVNYGSRRMVRALIDDVQRELLSVSAGNCKFYVCGGGAKALLNDLDGAWLHVPTLVFEGLLIAGNVVKNLE